MYKSYCKNAKKSLLAIILVSMLAVSIAVPLARAYPPVNTTGTAGNISVDGTITDWNIDLTNPTASPDFFACLYDGWNNNHKSTLLGYAFIRYDATNDVVYLLTLAKDGVGVETGTVPTAVNWVAIDDVKNKVANEFSGDNSFAPDFDFVTLSSQIRGYELSFPLGEGPYQIAIHLQVLVDSTSSKTAGTDNTFINLELPPDMQVPEHLYGGLAAIAACFVGFAAFKGRKTIQTRIHF